MQIDTSKLIEIIGTKEIEIYMLRERVAQLEAYVKNLEEKNSAESETVECE
jgi:hypothetical protein